MIWPIAIIVASISAVIASSLALVWALKRYEHAERMKQLDKDSAAHARIVKARHEQELLRADTPGGKLRFEAMRKSIEHREKLLERAREVELEAGEGWHSTSADLRRRARDLVLKGPDLASVYDRMNLPEL